MPHLYPPRLRAANMLLAGILLGSACAGSGPPAATQRPQASVPEREEEPRYSSEDAQRELDFGSEPSSRIRSRRRSTQHKSMKLHGAQAQPCAFDDCNISDEDDPLRDRTQR